MAEYPDSAAPPGAAPAHEQQAIGVGYWTLRLNDGIREVDSDAAEMLGLAPVHTRLTPATWAQLVHTADLAGSTRDMAHMPVRSASFRVRIGIGGWRWLEERVHRIERGEFGEGTRVHGVWIDVSASKRDEASLLERERRIRGALQVADNGWWEWDVAREWFSIAPSWLAMLGLSAVGAGKGLGAWLAFADDDDHARIRSVVDEHLEGRSRNIDVSFRVQSEFRGERWVQARGAVVERRPDGQPSRLLGTFVDQTEQFRAAREQRALLEKFELACESAGIGLVQYDWTKDHWTLDERSRDLFGFAEHGSPGSLLEFMKRLPEEDAQRLVSTLAAATDGHVGSIDFDFRVLRAEQTPRDIQALARIHFDDDGKPLDLIGFAVDVSSDREVRRMLEVHRTQLGVLVTEQTQAAIAARDRAQHASAIKSEFLANISHELRTPLHAIIGFSQLALDDGDTLDAKAVENYFRKVNTSARHLLRLVDDLLDLSKLESGNLALSREQQNVQRLLQSVCDEVAPLAAARRITLDLQADPALVWPLDPARFAQVVRNLVMNAIKYSPDAGVVELLVDLRASDGALQMRVRDHGQGIPEGALESIFERFRQGTNAARREGTGLGLAITRELVALHTGGICARNHAEGGAEFVVVLAKLPSAD